MASLAAIRTAERSEFAADMTTIGALYDTTRLEVGCQLSPMDTIEKAVIDMIVVSQVASFGFRLNHNLIRGGHIKFYHKN